MASRTLFACLLSIFAITAARADEAYVEEWRVLGPAISHHFSTDGARLHTTVSSATCYTEATLPPGLSATDPRAPALPANTCGAVNWKDVFEHEKAGTMAHECHWERWTNVYTPLVGDPWPTQVCTFSTSTTTKRWSEINPAFGLSYGRRTADHLDEIFATAVRDSYDQPSLMVGAGRLWSLGKLFTVQFDAGIVAGLWQRSVLDETQTQLLRRTVPFILPALSVTEDVTGLGLNLAFAPKLSIDGKTVVPTHTLMLQSTWRVHRSPTSPTVAVSGDAGGFNVQVSRAF